MVRRFRPVDGPRPRCAARDDHAVRDDRGSTTPVELALGLALLLVPTFALVTLFPQWAEARNVAVLAAEEGSRWGVTTAVPAEAAARAEAGVRRVVANYGLAQDRVAVAADCATVTAGGGACAVTVTVTVPAVPSPFGAGTVGGLDVSSTAVQQADRYRSVRDVPAPRAVPAP